MTLPQASIALCERRAREEDQAAMRAASAEAAFAHRRLADHDRAKARKPEAERPGMDMAAAWSPTEDHANGHQPGAPISGRIAQGGYGESQ